MPGPAPSDPPEKILRYVATWNDPFVMPKDIEPQLEVGQKQTLNRLRTLVEDGMLRSRTVGPNVTLFWMSEKGREILKEAEFHSEPSGR